MHRQAFRRSQQAIVGGDGDFRGLIKRSALEATRNIDPYFRALYEFERDQRRNTSSFDYVESLINEESLTVAGAEIEFVCQTKFPHGEGTVRRWS